MKTSYYSIERSVESDNTITYYVILNDNNSSKLVYQGESKNGVYQVAHRYAKMNNLPLYEQIYKALTDINGVEHLTPYKMKEIAVNYKVTA